MQVRGEFSTIFPNVTIGGGTRVGTLVMIRSDPLIGAEATYVRHRR
jgi:UDP-3-O-[3-hydroxymyristoyl] glucosamine N-acyltransferase